MLTAGKTDILEDAASLPLGMLPVVMDSGGERELDSPETAGVAPVVLSPGPISIISDMSDFTEASLVRRAGAVEPLTLRPESIDCEWTLFEEIINDNLSIVITDNRHALVHRDFRIGKQTRSPRVG